MSNTNFEKIGSTSSLALGIKSKPYTKMFVIPVTIVASTAEQDSGFTMPANAQEFATSVRVITAEVTGTTKTLDVGVTTNPDALIDDADVSATGMLGRTGGAGELSYPQQLSGINITYAFGSADFAELDAEIIVYVLAND